MNYDLLYIENILKSIELIEDYTKKISFQKFAKSNIIKDAVCKRLEEIGENARKISKKIQDKNKQIKWKEFIENRNFLTHVYQLVNNKKLWIIIKEDIPLLKKEIENIKQELK